MRIAIDAKQYFNGPISTRTILQNLLPKLFELYNENEWLVFFDKKDQHLGSPFQQQNIRIIYVPTLTNMFSNLFILPQQIAKLKPDVTLFMMFTPLFRKSRTAVFIHDVLFREYPQYFTRTEKLYFWPISRLTPKADRIICTSEYVSGKLLEYQFASTKSKIDIIPLGISEIF
ncbi:MAG: glycosyltransferase, partial [Flavisolibacter sp.]